MLCELPAIQIWLVSCFSGCSCIICSLTRTLLNGISSADYSTGINWAGSLPTVSASGCCRHPESFLFNIHCSIAVTVQDCAALRADLLHIRKDETIDKPGTPGVLIDKGFLVFIRVQPELIRFVHKPPPFFYDEYCTTRSITAGTGEDAVACFPVLMYFIYIYLYPQSGVCSVAASTASPSLWDFFYSFKIILNADICDIKTLMLSINDNIIIDAIPSTRYIPVWFLFTARYMIERIRFFLFSFRFILTWIY